MSGVGVSLERAGRGPMGYWGRADFHPTGGTNTLAPVTSSIVQTTRNYSKICLGKHGQPKTRDVRQRSKNNVGAAKNVTMLKKRGNYFIHKMRIHNKRFRKFQNTDYSDKLYE